MRLVDEEEIEMQKMKTRKMKKIIIGSIIFLLLLCIVIVVLIVYRIYNPTAVTTYIDGVLVQNFDQIVDFQTDENGQTQIYIPIRDFATYLNSVNSSFGYQTFKGDYYPKTEDENKCYIIREGYEVVIFTNQSEVLYKLSLQNNSSNTYEEYYMDRDVFENNGKLYASVQGIEEGYNVYFSYDEERKTITIYTMDYLIQNHQTALKGKSIGNFGEMSIDGSYENWKSVFDDLLIVQSSSRKYGIIKADDYSSFILEPQYDNIEFINNSSTFLVESNGKVGLFSEDGRRKIDLIYDEITSMGQDSNLYVVKTNNMYGVVDENGNIVIYPEYGGIGLDVSSFSYNEIKNGYIILDKLIPVQQNRKWAFFDKEGNMVTNGFIYQTIGCSNVRSVNNVYPLLYIPDYEVIVVGDEDGKYSFMDLTGNDTMLPFVFDSIYIKISGGETSYWMTYRNEEYEVLQYLKQIQ